MKNKRPEPTESLRIQKGAVRYRRMIRTLRRKCCRSILWRILRKAVQILKFLQIPRGILILVFLKMRELLRRQISEA